MGFSDVTALFAFVEMASADEFSVTPYSFEPEYEEEEKSSSNQNSKKVSCVTRKIMDIC